MKNSIWDILTGITLLGILCLIAAFGVILLRPGLVGNLLPAVGSGVDVELVPTIALPTDTEVPLALPPTWTPTPTVEVVQPVAEGEKPTLRPSSTPMPTNTVVVLPTFTPTKKVSSGVVGRGGGNCTVVYQNPADDSVMTGGQDFTTRWTLKNNSSNTWRSDSVDIKVSGGDRMHTGADLRDLPYDVGPNGMVDILIDMEAPDARATYTENWSLWQGGSQLCQFFVTIQVK